MLEMQVDFITLLVTLLIGIFVGALLTWVFTQRRFAPLQRKPVLTEKENFLRTVFENIRTPIFIINVEADGGYRMVMVNPVYIEEAPFSADDVVGKRMEDSPAIPAHILPSVRAHYDDCVKSGVPSTYDETVVLDGKQYWFTTSLNPVKDKNGRVYQIVGMSIETTEQRRMAQQAIDLELERERSRILTHFISNASHEFRTPLSIIRTGLYLLEKQTEPEDRQRRLNQIEAQTDVISSLVDDLHTLVRLDDPQSLKFVRADLDTAVTSAYERAKRQVETRKLVLERKPGVNNQFICGDVMYLTRALYELLFNAIRFTLDGGQVTIEMQEKETDAVIIIRDTGVGMDADTLQSAFNRFYRKDSAHTTAGLGLGLPIARKIIEAHNGRIELDSTLGVGTTVTITLPHDKSQQYAPDRG